MSECDRLIKLLDGADLFLRNRANAEPATLNEYDIENLNDIAKVCDEAARALEKAIIPPCKVGDKINGEVVCEMLYSETLGFEGNIHRNKQAYTCDKADTEKKIRVEHPITWEEAEQALKGGAE